MKKYLIYILLVILGVIIVYLILGDFLTNTLKKNTENPYAFDVKQYKKIDPKLIKYKEVKRISLDLPHPRGIDFYHSYLGIAYSEFIQLIDTTGGEVFRKSTDTANTCIAISREGIIYLGSGRKIQTFDINGNPLHQWGVPGDKVIITSIAFKNNDVYVANAGGHAVHRYNLKGELLNTFDGTGRLEGKFGFIIPSAYFDMAVSPDDQLWVVNPGIQSIENYTDTGILRAFWGKASFEAGGFTGCCNPAHLSILPDGSFVTCEKGIVRIKVYKPSGELDCVVAGPDSFDLDSEPLDLTVDENGRIYALDITRKMIRVFKRNI